LYNATSKHSSDFKIGLKKNEAKKKRVVSSLNLNGDFCAKKLKKKIKNKRKANATLIKKKTSKKRIHPSEHENTDENTRPLVECSYNSLPVLP